MKDYKLENGKLYFTSKVPPSTNHYLNWRCIKKGKFYIPSSYESEDYKIFKKEFKPYIENIVNELNWDIFPTENKHYFLDVIMYFDRTNKDSNNYFKCPMDVMNTTLYVDDKTIVSRANRVYYTYNDDCPPHFEYELYPVDYIGIWESENEYDEFIKVCKTCRNYKNHKCKRLSEFEEYKITKDFDYKTRKCLGYKLKK